MDRIQNSSSFYLAPCCSIYSKDNFKLKSHWQVPMMRYSKMLNRTNCYFGSGPVKKIFSFTKGEISLSEINISSTHTQFGPVEAKIWQFVLFSILLYLHVEPQAYRDFM